MTAENTFARQFLAEAREVIDRLDAASIEKAASLLALTRSTGGRLFILGVGGSAANASHAVNDFRKIAGIEAYAPTDNVSELTARTNDEGWATVFENWLKVSRLRPNDLVLVFSVGGGDLEKNVSPNLVAALQYARTVGAKILGIVGRDGGHTARVADVCVIIPTVNPAHITPHTEAFQAILWHLLVSHPAVKQQQTKWESTADCQLRPAVFLDRDGVLNRAVVRDGKPFPPSSVEEFEILPDVASSLLDLRAHGFALFVVTNQPDVARGTQTRDAIEAIHRTLASSLALDGIFVCYHDDSDDCACRKPNPGLLLEAQRKHNIDLSRSFVVGDRWRDIDAGHNAGCKTVLIDYGYRERKPAHPPEATVRSLREAADWILSSSLKESHNKDEVRV
ncbi:MAG TPA: HAD-IIIA family hydrolase [Candidatus Acidoferrum sp.]|jgi:D-sedoheptulose 7-phosphate isomerase|nr:HAD-IIIA family hydrolase [Candidatus Acidoferrum sp.]